MRCLMMMFAVLAACTGVSKNPGGGIDAAIDGAPDAADDDAAVPLARHHYVIDSQRVPINNATARDLALDVNDDGQVDNQLGMVLATLSSQGFEVQGPLDTNIDRGEILMLVELSSNGFASGPATFTLFSGATPQPAPCGGAADPVCRRHLDGTASFTVSPSSARDTPLAGAFQAGTLVTDPGDTNRLALQTNLGAEVTLDLIGARVKVTSASDAEIMSGVIAGAVPRSQIDTKLLPAWQATFDALVQRDCPGAPPSCGCATGSVGETYQQLFDTTPRDCNISLAEIENNSLVQSLLAPDVTIAGQQALSLGIGFTAVAATFTP